MGNVTMVDILFLLIYYINRNSCDLSFALYFTIIENFIETLRLMKIICILKRLLEKSSHFWNSYNVFEWGEAGSENTVARTHVHPLR